MSTTPRKQWLDTYPNLRRALVGIALVFIGQFLANGIPRLIDLPEAGEAVLMLAGLLLRVIGVVLFWGSIVLAIIARLTRRRELPVKPPAAPDSN